MKRRESTWLQVEDLLGGTLLDKELNRAFDLRTSGDLLGGIAILNECLAREQQNPVVLKLLTVFCYEVNDFQSASEFARRAIGYHPRSFVTSDILFNSLLQLGAIREGLREGLRFMGIYEADPALLAGLPDDCREGVVEYIDTIKEFLRNFGPASEEVDAALELREAGKFQDAIKIFEEILSREGEIHGTLCHLAVLYYEMEDFRSAISCARRAIALDPECWRCSMALFEALLGQEEVDKSIEEGVRFLAVYEKNPTLISENNELGVGHVAKIRALLQEELKEIMPHLEFIMPENSNHWATSRIVCQLDVRSSNLTSWPCASVIRTNCSDY